MIWESNRKKTDKILCIHKKADKPLSEAKRMYERFKDETPLLDAIKNLRLN